MIHATCGFNDGALMAHIGPPTCATQSFFALTTRAATLPVERLTLPKSGSFEIPVRPNDVRWPACA